MSGLRLALGIATVVCGSTVSGQQVVVPAIAMDDQFEKTPDVPVWLDFADLIKTQFPFQAGVPNVVVLDTLGRYRYSTGGQSTSEATQHLADVIEALRREALK